MDISRKLDELRASLSKEQSVSEEYKKVFNSVEGKVVLKDLALNSNFINATIAKNVSSQEAAAREGARQLFLYIIKQCNFDINYIISMAENALKKERDFEEI